MRSRTGETETKCRQITSNSLRVALTRRNCSQSRHLRDPKTAPKRRKPDCAGRLVSRLSVCLSAAASLSLAAALMSPLTSRLTFTVLMGCASLSLANGTHRICWGWFFAPLVVGFRFRLKMKTKRNLWWMCKCRSSALDVNWARSLDALPLMAFFDRDDLSLLVCRAASHGC